MAKIVNLTENNMKTTLIILITFIASVSVSFGAGNGFQFTPTAESMPLEEYLDNYATTYEIQADQELIAGAGDVRALSFNEAIETEGLFAVYSIDNVLINTAEIDHSTNLESYLAQVKQAQKVAMSDYVAMEKVEINETCEKC
jgi:hypothetical protein